MEIRKSPHDAQAFFRRARRAVRFGAHRLENLLGHEIVAELVESAHHLAQGRREVSREKLRIGRRRGPPYPALQGDSLLLKLGGDCPGGEGGGVRDGDPVQLHSVSLPETSR